MDIRTVLEKELSARDLLFLGIVPLDVTWDYEKYRVWLSEKRHAEMAYLEKNLPVRERPEGLLLDARCAIVVGLPYYQEGQEGQEGQETSVGDVAVPQVAQYARFRDYHKELKGRLAEVVDLLMIQSPGSFFRVAVDTLPLLERSLAKQSREGFIGKNTCYIHPSVGSFLLLGEILTTADLTPDIREADGVGCGACTRCQIECPTGALDTDYQIDSRRCLAYWTIEHRGTIPFEFWPHLSRYYFGCDICQNVCPFNEAARANGLPKSLTPIKMPTLFDVAVMTPKLYEVYFSGTPMTRAKREGLIRNALIAMTVTDDPKLDLAMEKNQDSDHAVIQETLEQVKIFRSRSIPQGISATSIQEASQSRSLNCENLQ